MLVNTFGKKITASCVAKDSQFYVEVAKFVEAYKMILSNPNYFLQKINGTEIDEKSGKLTWNNLSLILQKCDFGFKTNVTNNELKIYYNYAVQIGSISKEQKHLATTNEIEDAQSNYYNFIEDAKVKAENKLKKQEILAVVRENEAKDVHKELSILKTKKMFTFSLMILSVLLFSYGVAGLFYEDVVLNIFKFENGYIISSLINITIALILFAILNKYNLRYKKEYFDLNYVSQTIFTKDNETYNENQILQRKFDKLEKKYNEAKSELEDKDKSFDVIKNIENLVVKNENYKKFYAGDLKPETTANQNQNVINMLDEKNGEGMISLKGHLDEKAYNEKFEKSRIVKKQNKNTNEEKDKLSKTDKIVSNDNDELNTKTVQGNGKNIENNTQKVIDDEIEEIETKEKEEKDKKDKKEKDEKQQVKEKHLQEQNLNKINEKKKKTKKTNSIEKILDK